MKKIYSFLLAVICLVLVSCGGNDQITYPEIQKPKTEELVFSSGEEIASLQDDKYAVRFKADEDIYAFNVYFVKDKGDSAELFLYQWNSDYNTTLAQKPIKVFPMNNLQNKDVGIVCGVTFLSEQMPSKGEYLILFSSETAAGLLMGKKTDDAVKNGIVCYKNGVEIQQAPNASVGYYIGY